MKRRIEARRKTANCTILNKPYKMWYKEQFWETCHDLYIKRRMNEFINVPHIFINDISTYIATFCELKKRT